MEKAPKTEQKVIITPEFIKQVAAMAATGASQAVIAKELNVGKTTISRALSRPEAKELVTEIAEDAVAAAKAKLRIKISDLADAVYDALKYQIEKKKSVQAIQVALRVMGVDEQDEVTGTGNITVYLPGSKPEPLTVETTRVKHGDKV